MRLASSNRLRLAGTFAAATFVASLLQDLVLHDATRVLAAPFASPLAAALLGQLAIAAAALLAALVVLAPTQRVVGTVWRKVGHLGLVSGALAPALALVSSQAYGPMVGVLTWLAVPLVVLAKGAARPRGDPSAWQG
jgi:hypothetical protein